MSNLTEELASFAVSTAYNDLPAPVVRETKLLLMDSIGNALAGITADPGKMAIALAKRLGGPPEASIIGVGDKVSCTSAAFANGQLVNTPDYDALMPGGHAPAYIVPSVLAIAESTGASGKDLILATALGFEVAARVYSGMQDASPTGTKPFKWPERQGYANCNFGVAAGAGRLIKLNKDKMTHALGIAGHMSQVLPWVRQSFSEHRPMTKYGVPGWQNTGGIMAALWAEMGYMGDTTIFDPADQGFWKFVGYADWHPEKVTDGMGKTWLFITRVNYKPYPCCRVLHPALECLRSIMEKNKLAPGDIESVKGYLPKTVEAPLFQNRELTNIVDFQFGLPYVLAVVAHGIRPGVEWQDMDTLKDPKIQSFAEKVSVIVNPKTETDPQLTTIEVTAGGKTFKEEKKMPHGSADSPMTEDELVVKYCHNAQRILTLDKIDNSVDTLLNLEKLADVSQLIEQITM
jgi:2-methylcitrate dehydratase PrpD